MRVNEKRIRDLYELWLDRLMQKISLEEFRNRVVADEKAGMSSGEYEVFHCCLRQQSDRYLREMREERAGLNSTLEQRLKLTR
jgi:hypothetical protein